jgi:hypothetical protein
MVKGCFLIIHFFFASNHINKKIRSKLTTNIPLKTHKEKFNLRQFTFPQQTQTSITQNINLFTYTQFTIKKQQR